MSELTRALTKCWDGTLSKRYEKSGLYQNNGSTTPLWTVDWYAYRVHIVSVGVHMVRPGPWATGTRNPAVTFYRNGTP